jgi:hypothetical protein
MTSWFIRNCENVAAIFFNPNGALALSRLCGVAISCICPSYLLQHFTGTIAKIKSEIAMPLPVYYQDWQCRGQHRSRRR